MFSVLFTLLLLSLTPTSDTCMLSQCILRLLVLTGSLGERVSVDTCCCPEFLLNVHSRMSRWGFTVVSVNVAVVGDLVHGEG